MSRFSRRDMLGAVVTTSAALGAAAVAQAEPKQLPIQSMKKTAQNATVYHCDFGDQQRFSAMLQNMNNHYSAYDFDTFKLKLVMVVHSAGIKFFLDDLSGTPWEKDSIDPDIYKRFVGLTKYGVEAYLCQITYKRLNIDPAKTRADEFLKFVPSGVATVAELQGKGFAYLKVG